MHQTEPDERRRDRERGASLVEYALLVALIAVVCIGAVTLLGRNSSTKMSSAGTAVGGADDPYAGWICYPDGGGGHYFYEPDTHVVSYTTDGPCP